MSPIEVHKSHAFLYVPFKGIMRENVSTASSFFVSHGWFLLFWYLVFNFFLMAVDPVEFWPNQIHLCTQIITFSTDSENRHSDYHLDKVPQTLNCLCYVRWAHCTEHNFFIGAFWWWMSRCVMASFEHFQEWSKSEPLGCEQLERENWHCWSSFIPLCVFLCVHQRLKHPTAADTLKTPGLRFKDRNGVRLSRHKST